MNLVTGVFDSVMHAENAVRDLMHERFSDDHIGVITKDRSKGTTLADDLGRDYASGVTPPRDVVTSRGDVYDRLPDAFVDTVHRAEMPNEAVDWYRHHLDQGHILVVVRAGDRMDDASRIIRHHNGTLYHTEARREPVSRERTTTMEGQEVRMPIVDEEVIVEKQKHQVGEVRVTPETTRETVEVPTTVTHEEIRVERRKLERPVHPDEYKGHRAENGEIRMPIIEEEIRVMKEPIVREEMVITRTPVSERKTIRETVTHSEPHVETTGGVEVEGRKEVRDTEREQRERRRRPAA